MTDAERLVLVLCADLLLAADGHDRKANVMQMRERLRQARHDLDSEAIANAATLAAVELLVDAIHVGAKPKYKAVAEALRQAAKETEHLRLAPLRSEPSEATLQRAMEAIARGGVI